MFTTAPDGTLNECTDFVFSYTEPSAADASVDPLSFVRRDGGPVQKTLQLAKKDKATVLKKMCAEQFTDRTALASCLVQKAHNTDAGAHIETTMGSYYYNLSTLSVSDTYMKQCIEMGGDWKAVARDSVEWQAAKVEQHRKLIGKMLAEPAD